jgi:hypothetical protein
MIVTPEGVVSTVGGSYRPSGRCTGGSGASATWLPLPRTRQVGLSGRPSPAEVAEGPEGEEAIGKLVATAVAETPKVAEAVKIPAREEAVAAAVEPPRIQPAEADPRSSEA